ncbi:MAG TPA: hypothetical protein ENK16_06605 [Chromatiales bacterium]|nr:hypothetical protein [Chromatiales bacterium]
MKKAPGRVQLALASMQVPDALLQGYRVSGEQRYLDAAVEATLSWARDDWTRWFPVGLTWNDHALAVRAVYLSNFWQVYRHSSVFNSRDAAEILAFLYRTVARLAKPSQFTFRTNHGIMQNLALLHVAAALPALPGREKFLDVALQRLEAQLPFFVSDTGVVLEHSASYQEFGVQLLLSLEHYLAVLDRPVPESWKRKVNASVCFLGRMARPDGSLPYYGDSHGRFVVPGLARLVRDRIASNPSFCASLPVVDQDFGYAIVNTRSQDTVSQTFVAWADFPGRAHKHADELSLALWQGGHDWWAGSGYWPYGDASRAAAVSWRGSNAPHFKGEAASSMRESWLQAYDVAEDFFMLDLRRDLSGAGEVRRQIIHVAPDVWLVMDSGDTAGGKPVLLETVWSVAPGVNIADEQQGFFKLHANPANQGLLVGFVNPDGNRAQPVTGQRDPFGGMTALPDGRIAVGAYFPVGSQLPAWTVSLWFAGNSSIQPTGPVTVDWSNPERWRVAWRSADGRVEYLHRAGNQLQMELLHSGRRRHVLQHGDQQRLQLKQAIAAYEAARARYHHFRDLIPYRLRLSLLVAVLFVISAVSGLVLQRRSAGVQVVSAFAIVLGWVLAAVWIAAVYLQ